MARTIHRDPEQIELDDLTDCFTSIVSAIQSDTRIPVAVANDIAATIDDLKIKALRHFMARLDARDRRITELEESVSVKDARIEDLVFAAHNASIDLERAHTEHEYAQSFGWVDRDAQAWAIVGTALSEITAILPISA